MIVELVFRAVTLLAVAWAMVSMVLVVALGVLVAVDSLRHEARKPA